MLAIPRRHPAATTAFLAIAAMTVLAVPGAALAHTGAGSAHSFLAGFGHPLGGLDHLLAMVAVGLLAAHLGGRALWALPATFLGAMALGGALALAGAGLPFVELGIGVSVVAIAAAMFLPVALPLAGMALLIGGFAVFHGFAHGAEMAAGASATGYGAGFLLATALLHAAGITLGLAFAALAGSNRQSLTRIAAGLIALAGGGLLAGLA